VIGHAPPLAFSGGACYYFNEPSESVVEDESMYHRRFGVMKNRTDVLRGRKEVSNEI